MTLDPRWLNDDEQELWRLMLAASRKISRVIDDTLQAESDLSSSEFAVLVSLSEAENHSLRLRDLCAVLDWDRSRTSHQVTRMEKRGLVTKAKSPGDARGVLVCLTDEGMRRLEAAAPEHVESVRRLVFDHMDPETAAPLRAFFTSVLGVTNVPGHADYRGAQPMTDPSHR
ncbi:MarR family winged helix-turn-helix transcriptional regulator [Corynebacterium imitans]|uniref:MarR family winged helix-turn-helix transcriptional regulator n=1 Tax=Corynebacterium imitans TaxID=156978 RepID=UPI001EF1E08D|nr:MarR family winged helix-turn-helix transcriptional regulator [Corynebacterium imitans]MCG7278145.1 MarR family winged helix-turn-helix transcriptional regulator [Corynebacterium imitans]